MKRAFFDTNLIIAYLFFLNSLHLQSKEAFKIYDELYWSNFVQEEFNHRFLIKQKYLKLFFNDLQKYLQNPNQEFYSYFDLKNFALDNYSGKFMEDVKSSISPFWNEYFGIETQISFFDIKKAINYCLKDLSITLNSNKKDLENIMHLTPKRTNDYPDIDILLKNNRVSDEDRIVILDGHDFACFSSDPIDFVTFDNDCFNGANSLEMLCFESVKGKHDFKY